MERFELQKRISHLFDVLRNDILRVILFQTGSSEQSIKVHNFREIIFCEVISHFQTFALIKSSLLSHVDTHSTLSPWRIM